MQFVKHVLKWIQGKIKYLPFAVPMIWREPASHEDCYFFNKNKRHSNKNKANFVLPEIISTI